MNGKLARLLAIGVLLAPGASRAAELSGAELVARYSPAVVSLSVTLRTEMEGSGGSPEETRTEIACTVVDRAG